MAFGESHFAPAGRLIGRQHVRLAGVDIDADEVERTGDDLQILVREPGSVLSGLLQIVICVSTFQHDREIGRVEFTRRRLSGLDVLRALDQGHGKFDVFRRPDLRSLSSLGANRLDREAVSQHCVVTYLVEFLRRQLQARREKDRSGSARRRDLEAFVSGLGERAELVDREKVADAIGEFLRNVTGIVGKRLRRIARLPTSLVMQRLRQIPVIQRCKRLDARAFQFIDQATVEVQPFRIRSTGSLRKDSRPRDREPVRRCADILHQRHILLVAMIVIVGDVAGVAIADLAGGMGVRIPNGWPLAVLVPCALDLVCRGRDAPEEALRKRAIPLARC